MARMGAPCNKEALPEAPATVHGRWPGGHVLAGSCVPRRPSGFPPHWPQHADDSLAAAQLAQRALRLRLGAPDNSGDDGGEEQRRDCCSGSRPQWPCHRGAAQCSALHARLARATLHGAQDPVKVLPEPGARRVREHSRARWRLAAHLLADAAAWAAGLSVAELCEAVQIIWGASSPSATAMRRARPAVDCAAGAPGRTPA